MQAKEKARAMAGRMTGDDDRSPYRVTAQQLRIRVEGMITRELQRCERCMMPAQWAEHREWVTANVVEAARLWMREKSARGEL